MGRPAKSWTYNYEKLARAFAMSEDALRMAIYRGQLDPNDLNSVIAFGAARKAVLSEEKRTRLEVSAAPRGTVLSEKRLNDLYDLVGEAPPFDFPSLIERLCEDRLFVESIRGVFEVERVEEGLFDTTLDSLVTDAFRDVVAEDHLKHLWGAIRSAAHRVHKALKKTMGNSFYTFSGDKQSKPLALKGPQSAHLKAAVTRAKVHQGILRQQQKRAG